MSQLSVYQPELADATDEPVIFSFDAYYEPETINFQDALLERARQLRANKSCPHCQSLQVLPVEASSHRGSYAYRNMATSSVMSEFACQKCHWSWKAR